MTTSRANWDDQKGNLFDVLVLAMGGPPEVVIGAFLRGTRVVHYYRCSQNTTRTRGQD